MRESFVKIGEVVELATERLAYGGDGVARFDGMVVFVAGAAPGERVRARIVERRKNMARAVVEEILEASPARRTPPCPHFGGCGGCQLQHLDYAAQLEAKAGFVRDALTRIGRIDWPDEIPIRAASEFDYRLRAQIKIDARSANEPRIGFHQAHSHAVCDIDRCPVLVPALNEGLAALRHVVRDMPESQRRELPAEIELAAGDQSIAAQPPIAGIAGGRVRRSVLGIDYEFAPSTFFQGNAALLEELISEAAGGEAGDFAIDLYAGVGLFTAQLARRFARVVGVESDRQTARLARRNLTANNISNAELANEPVNRWLQRFAGGETRRQQPDLILLDPPRNGAFEAVRDIAALQPARIVYVSCDPTTLARDLRVLIDGSYRLESVVAFDLFPQTFHVETVAKMIRAAEQRGC